jgi:hypothetical protein
VPRDLAAQSFRSVPIFLLQATPSSNRNPAFPRELSATGSPKMTHDLGKGAPSDPSDRNRPVRAIVPKGYRQDCDDGNCEEDSSQTCELCAAKNR